MTHREFVDYIKDNMPVKIRYSGASVDKSLDGLFGFEIVFENGDVVEVDAGTLYDQGILEYSIEKKR